jgi:hypothetical protein
MWREPGELAEQVRLLGGERRAAVERDGVRPVLLRDLAQAAGREVERLVPGGLAEAAARSHERREEPIGMRILQVAAHALGAEHAAVERELLPGLEADHLVVDHLQLDPALLPAEAAVRLHQPVGLAPGLLAVGHARRVLRVRPVHGLQRVDVRSGCHVLSHQGQKAEG